MRRRPSKINRALAVILASLVELLVGVVFFTGRFVPEKFTIRVGPLIGWLTRRGRKREILARWRLLTDEAAASGPAEKSFWRAHLAHVGRTVLEPFYFFRMTEPEGMARVSLTGEEHLRGALAKGRGAVLFLNHLGNPGALLVAMYLGGFDLTVAGNAMDITIAGETVPLKRLEGLVRRMFARARVQRALLGDRLPQQLSETLARNGLFGMFIDFPVVGKHNELLPFGGSRLNVNLGPAILALRHRAVALGVTCLRMDGGRHQVIIHPPLESPLDAGRAGAAQLMESALAQMLPELRRHPEQWWSWDWARIEPRD